MCSCCSVIAFSIKAKKRIRWIGSGHEYDSFVVEFDESAFTSYNERRKGATGNGQPETVLKD